MNRVQESGDDRGRRGGQQEDEEDKKKKEKDKFEMAGKPRLSFGGALSREDTEPEEDSSLTMSQRILVLWGILDTTGKPRIPVIATYGIVAVVIATSLIMILSIVWR